jgi:hypothetical protein
LVFKEAPRLVFTGLSKALGAPRDLERNLDDARYFESPVDISIPHAETNEMKAKPVVVVKPVAVAAVI